MLRMAMAVPVVLLAALGAADASSSSQRAACPTSTVHYSSHPGVSASLGNSPWVQASPTTQGLVGFLFYWPDEWRASHVTTAQMYTGGHAPNGGVNMKILWAFLAPSARRATDAQVLIVKAHRLDGPGKTWQRFTAITYSGQQRAPSYASGINLPTAGCWRIEATAGSLRGVTTFLALAN